MSQPVRVTLGPTYSPDLWDLRKRVSEARAKGEPLVFVALTAPVTAPVIEVAIESGSLYLIGVRAQGGVWYEFAPDEERGPQGPRLPGSRWIMAGGARALSTYRALRLTAMVREGAGSTGQISYVGRPNDLMDFFHGWDGRIDGIHVRLPLCVLIFVVCEALRFRRIETLCYDWAWTHGFRAYRATGAAMSSVGEALPGILPHGQVAFTFTEAMLTIVQNWRSGALKGDPDIWTWLPDMPDPLIT